MNDGLEKLKTSVPKSVYCGLFFIALATLMYELLLTRIFSVTMYYHFAFMVVSTAMFGMTLGAMLLYMFPALQEQEGLAKRLSLLSLFCAISVIVSMVLHIELPSAGNPVAQAVFISLTYVCVSIPFVFGGMLISLLFKTYNKLVGHLYAADLCGAASGCLLLVLSLNALDGFSTVLLVAFWACIAALCFAQSCQASFRNSVLGITVCAALAVSLHSYLFNSDLPGAVRIHWVKGAYVEKPLYEKWNSFSRVTVWGDMNKPSFFSYPGVSTAYKVPPSKGLNVDIDGCARTTMVGLDGDYRKLEAPRFNASNIVYQLKENAKVLIIGSGGGYDVVSALSLGAKSVEAVDINNNIISAVNERFGDFSGHLNKLSNVKFVNDEARSHIARSPELFDIIEMSFIDTWAATASGAYVLTENALYTVDGWDVFLNHLSPQGIFSVSRWYEKKTPAEMYRLTALAAESLRRLNVADPRQHMIIVRNTPEAVGKEEGPDGVGIMLISRSPFSKEQLERLNNICRPLRFEIILSPETSCDPMFAALSTPSSPTQVYKDFPLNIAPPTDDSPFFFNMMRLENIFDQNLEKKFSYTFNLQAVSTLFGLLLSSLGLSYLCIYLPCRFSKQEISFKGTGPLIGYFLSIGLAFMFIEISQIQRSIVFLGHPVYGITVVLFTLLVGSGIGSYFSDKITSSQDKLQKLIGALPVVLAIYGLASPALFDLCRNSETPVRLAVSAVSLFIIGFFMGCAFPSGIKACAKKEHALIPFYWGINGAGSVCGSVLALLVSIVFGISALYWLGVAVYVAAFFALLQAGKEDHSEQPAP